MPFLLTPCVGRMCQPPVGVSVHSSCAYRYERCARCIEHLCCLWRYLQLMSLAQGTVHHQPPPAAMAAAAAVAAAAAELLCSLHRYVRVLCVTVCLCLSAGYVLSTGHRALAATSRGYGCCC
jgi:hypothetical protein